MIANQKIAYGSIGWVTWALSEVAANLGSMGIRGIEGFGLNELMPEDNELKVKLARLEVSFVGSYFGASMVQKDRWETEVANFTSTVKSVAELGGNIVSVGGGRFYPGLSNQRRSEDWARLIEGAHTFGRIAQQHGVKFGFHPHDHTLVFRHDDIERFLKDTDPALVGLTFDTAHFGAADMNILDQLKSHFKRIVHVHLKDEKDGRFLELGRGRLPLKEFLASLHGGGYNGWITIELDATPDPVASATDSLAHLLKLLDSLS